MMNTSMMAVSDDEYLDDSMKVGCGSSGIKDLSARHFNALLWNSRKSTIRKLRVLCVV